MKIFAFGIAGAKILSSGKCATKIFTLGKVSAKIFASGNVNAKFLFSFVQLPSNGHNFFISASNCTPFEVFDS